MGLHRLQEQLQGVRESRDSKKGEFRSDVIWDFLKLESSQVMWGQPGQARHGVSGE